MFLEMNEADLSAGEKFYFNKDEVVELQCLATSENTDKGFIKLQCLVTSGDHTGKGIDIIVSSKNAIGRAQFAKAFWTKEEILSGQASLARLVGRKFSSKASEVKEYNGYKNQYWSHYVDLGTSEEEQAEVEELAEAAF